MKNHDGYNIGKNENNKKKARSNIVNFFFYDFINKYNTPYGQASADQSGGQVQQIMRIKYINFNLQKIKLKQKKIH